jgi:hypothetical protein
LKPQAEGQRQGHVAVPKLPDLVKLLSTKNVTNEYFELESLNALTTPRLDFANCPLAQLYKSSKPAHDQGIYIYILIDRRPLYHHPHTPP